MKSLGIIRETSKLIVAMLYCKHTCSASTANSQISTLSYFNGENIHGRKCQFWKNFGWRSIPMRDLHFDELNVWHVIEYIQFQSIKNYKVILMWFLESVHCVTLMDVSSILILKSWTMQN